MACSKLGSRPARTPRFDTAHDPAEPRVGVCRFRAAPTASAHRQPVIYAHGFRVVLDRGADLRPVFFGEVVAVSIDIVEAAGLRMDVLLGLVEILPHAYHHEGEQHRIGDADHGIFEAGDFLFGGDELHAVNAPDEEL